MYNTELIKQDEAAIEADAVREQADAVADAIFQHTLGLEQGFVSLMPLLKAIHDGRLWQSWGYLSFNAYLEYIEPKIGRGVRYCRQLLETAKLLQLPEADLREIGVTRAIALKDYCRVAGKQPSPELLARAKDPEVSVRTLQNELYTASHGAPPENTKYYHLDYVATDLQQNLINAVFKLALKVVNIDPDKSKEFQAGLILNALCQNVYVEWQHQENAIDSNGGDL